MTQSDYWDAEILASRMGILPSEYIARQEKKQTGNKKRQRRFHKAHEGYRTEQSRKWREDHPEYYTNAQHDRSEYYREYYQRNKAAKSEYFREYYQGKKTKMRDIQ